MIEAIAVVQPAHSSRALSQPAVIVARHRLPVVDGQAPVLPGGAEGIGRRARGAIEAEQVLVRPDVGAVGADHEGHVAEQPDLAERLARIGPLLIGEPLRVLVVEDLALQCFARILERGRLSGSDRQRPVGPRQAAVVSAQRAVERVVAEPPVFPRRKRRERSRACRAAQPVGVVEQTEGQPERGIFRLPHGGVRDTRGRTGGPERRLIGQRQLRLAAEHAEVVHVWHRDVDGIDRHRAERGIWRRLTRRQRADRQQLQRAKPGAAQPRRRTARDRRCRRCPSPRPNAARTAAGQCRRRGRDADGESFDRRGQARATAANSRPTASRNTSGHASRLTTR